MVLLPIIPSKHIELLLVKSCSVVFYLRSLVQPILDCNSTLNALRLSDVKFGGIRGDNPLKFGLFLEGKEDVVLRRAAP